MPKTKQPKSKKIRIRIWTRAYRPFILGGDVHSPVFIETQAEGPVALGKGYFGYLVTAPNGTTLVAESQTGAVIGSTLEAVKEDIATAEKAVMKQQIEDAKIKSSRAVPISNKEFWTMMDKASLRNTE